VWATATGVLYPDHQRQLLQTFVEVYVDVKQKDVRSMNGIAKKGAQAFRQQKKEAAPTPARSIRA